MRSLNAEALTEKIFSPYGVFYDLRAEGTAGEVIRSVGEGYSDSFTKQPLIDRPGSLGLTCASAVPYTIEKMERHLHTREAMMCAGEPIAFLTAPACADAPEEAEVRAFRLEPGQVVVLERGIWHSPAFGIQGPAAYYWMAEAYEGEPTVWKAIKGGAARFMTPLNRGNVSKTLVEGLQSSGVSPDYILWDDTLADSKCIIFLTDDNNTVMIVNTGLTEILFLRPCSSVCSKWSRGRLPCLLPQLPPFAYRGLAQGQALFPRSRFSFLLRNKTL